MQVTTGLLAACGCLIALMTVPDVRAEPPFVFRDVGDETGFLPAAAGIAGHAAAWGDIDGNGYPDLYIATFGGEPYKSKPNLLLRNDGGRFRLDEQEHLRVLARAGGAVFADLNNNGRLDLYLSNHAIDAATYGQPHYGTLNFLFRNDGEGKFTDVTEGSGTRPEDFRGRSVTVLDYDGDGLLDLLVGECFLQGGESRSKLFRNLGGMKFQDVTREAGLPETATGLGVAAGDVTGNGWPDVFLAGRNGNVLLVNDGQGRFREVPKAHADFAWKYEDTPDDTTCGVCFADVNGDGLADIIVGSHFDRPWWTGGVPVRLWLNRGVEGGFPRFEDVTEAAGLTPLTMKSPHIEVQDFDNDGLPDIFVSIVKFDGQGKPYPVIFRNTGLRDGIPRFEEHAMGVNDFPTAEDRQMESVVPFFDKMLREKKIMYMATAPTADFDRDGRIDIVLTNWWVSERSLLLRNETEAGNWLQISVEGSDGVNRMGIGAVVRVFPAGRLGQADALLGTREISAGYGYTSGQEAVAHFGLGDREECDVEVLLPHGKGRLERAGVQANQRITIKPGAPD